jgi:hypothetical protein
VVGPSPVAPEPAVDENSALAVSGELATSAPPIEPEAEPAEEATLLLEAPEEPSAALMPGPAEGQPQPDEADVEPPIHPAT